MTINIRSKEGDIDEIELSMTSEGLISINTTNEFYEMSMYGEFDLEEFKKAITFLEDDNKRAN